MATHKRLKKKKTIQKFLKYKEENWPHFGRNKSFLKTIFELVYLELYQKKKKKLSLPNYFKYTGYNKNTLLLKYVNLYAMKYTNI